jgi:hypothetical protein
VRVTGAEHLAAVAVNGNAQLIGLDVAQGGNVVGHLALIDQGAHFVEYFVE